MKYGFYAFLVLLSASLLFSSCASTNQASCPTFKQNGNTAFAKKDRANKKFSHGALPATTAAAETQAVEAVGETAQVSTTTTTPEVAPAITPTATTETSIEPTLTASANDELVVLPPQPVFTRKAATEPLAMTKQLATAKPKKGLAAIGQVMQVKKQLREAQKQQPRDGQGTQATGDGYVLGLLSLIFGAVGLFFSLFTGIGGLLWGIAGLVLGILALNTSRGARMGKLGLIFGAIVIALAILSIIVGGIIVFSN